MITIIKNAKVYSPQFLGKKDLLIFNDKIEALDDKLEYNFSGLEVKTIDATDKLLIPGLIDNHVHILGGGGEGGFKTRTPEIKLTDITTAGVTTVIGCLGTDGFTRNMNSMLAKARGLEEEGISTFIYSGSYGLPVTTITGDITRDLITIDKVIGSGEIAISDHRSSQPSFEEFAKFVAAVRLGGILSGKAGVVNIHMGDGARMLELVLRVIGETEIPMGQFLPTHMNRNPELFAEAKKYGKSGGFIDFTSSTCPQFWEEGETKCSKALADCLDAGIPDTNITLSSDGQGSLPSFNDKGELVGLDVGRCTSLLEQIRDAVFEDGVAIESALKTATSNTATILKLPNKGLIEPGFDADLVILDESSFEIEAVIAKGRMMIENKEIKVFDTFK